MSVVKSTPFRIVEYPHPTLRHVSKPLGRVDAEVRRMIRDMFGLMYEAKGVGLAANQVDLPYRFFVVNPTSDPEEKDQEHVFINPVITSRSGIAEAEEGCLSLPEVNGDIKRPEKIVVEAYNLEGHQFRFELEDLPARVVQHEIDHLDGVLFIDRLSPTGRLAIKEMLQEFELAFAGRRRRGEIPDDEEIAARLAELERLRT